jgi:hypothetical protein
MPLSPGAAACVVLLLLSPPSTSFRHRLVDLIPKSVPLAASLGISGDDEGITMVVDRLKAYLLSRYSGDEGVEDFTFLDVEELAFAVLPRKGTAADFVLAARLVDRGEPIRVKAGKHDIRLNIRNKDTARAFKRSVLVALLEILVQEGSESSRKVSSPAGDVEVSTAISSYAFFGDDVVVGSSKEAVEACGEAAARTEARLSSSAPYQEISGRLSRSPSDLRVFVDNRGDDFKKYVTLCRADWGPVLLTMAESVDYLGVAADIVDADSMGARIVAHSPDASRAAATRAVVESTLPVFIERYLGDTVKPKFTISGDGLYLTVVVSAEGLSGYWDDLFATDEGGGGG